MAEPLTLKVVWEPGQVMALMRLGGPGAVTDLVGVVLNEVLLEASLWLHKNGVTDEQLLDGLAKVDVKDLKKRVDILLADERDKL